MAPNVTISFWAPDDINGTPVLTIDDEDPFFKSLKLQPDLYSLGGWELTMSRSINFGVGDNGATRAEAFVRFMVHAYSDTDWYWGGFVQKRQMDVVDRNELGAEEFVIGGPGPKAYLDRYRLGIEAQVSADWNLDLENGVWRWSVNAPAGKILRKVIAEDEASTPTALVDMTQSFSATDDSNGVTWTDDIAGPENYETPVGTSLLHVLWDLEDLADLYSDVYLGTESEPTFLLNAYQSYGDDVSSGTFGMGVCLLREGVNIANEALTVEGVSIREATHVIIEGKDGAWATEVKSSWSPGDYVKWAKIEYTRSGVEAVLQRAGLRWLRRQENGDKEITVEILPGDAEATGLYFPMPGGVMWLGNTITLDTSADGTIHYAFDYNNEDQLVTGFEITLGPAGDDSTTDKAAKSWDVKVKLNHERAGHAQAPRQRSAASGGGGCKCIDLCRIHIPGTPPSETVTPMLNFNAQGDGGDGLTWTGLLDNQAPGAAAGSTHYYFKSNSPNQWSNTYAVSAGVDLRITGYVSAGTGGGLEMGFFNSGQGIGSAGNNTFLIGTATTLQAGPAGHWAFFSVDVTTPVGTVCLALGKMGSVTVDFDQIAIETVDFDPGDDGQAGDCPEDVGLECASGTGSRAARCDHVHAHGFLSDDEAHAHNSSDIEGLGGGSVTWEQDINETGSSFANFTAASGTWASNGTIIQQTNNTATTRRVKYNTALPLGLGYIFEAEIRLPTTGQGASPVAGLLLGTDGSTANSYAVRIESTTDRVAFEREGGAIYRNVTKTINLDTWYKLRVMEVSGLVTAYLDGVFVGSNRPSQQGAFAAQCDFLGLYCNNAVVDYRNIKSWTLRGGVPA